MRFKSGNNTLLPMRCICPLRNGISIYFISFFGVFLYLALICVSGEIIYNVW